MSLQLGKSISGQFYERSTIDWKVAYYSAMIGSVIIYNRKVFPKVSNNRVTKDLASETNSFKSYGKGPHVLSIFSFDLSKVSREKEMSRRRRTNCWEEEI